MNAREVAAEASAAWRTREPIKRLWLAPMQALLGARGRRAAPTRGPNWGHRAQARGAAARRRGAISSSAAGRSFGDSGRCERSSDGMLITSFGQRLRQPLRDAAHSQPHYNGGPPNPAKFRTD